MQPVGLFGGSFSRSTDGIEGKLLLKMPHVGVRVPFFFVCGGDVETQMLFHGAMGLKGEKPWMSTGNQGGNSVASVNTGAGSHICTKQLAVSHTCFWCPPGLVG